MTGFYVDENAIDFELMVVNSGNLVGVCLRLCQLFSFPFLFPEEINVLDNFTVFQRIIFFDFTVELWEFSNNQFVGLLSEG